MQLGDANDYRSILNSPKGLQPSKNFGRGIVGKDETGYEFQTANITDLNQLSKVVKTATEQLNAGYIARAPKVKSVPSIVTLDTVAQDDISLSKFPIGYDVSIKEIENYDFTKNKINFITGTNIMKDNSFVQAMIQQLKSIAALNVKIIDFSSSLKTIENVIIDKFDQEIITINNEIAQEGQNNNINVYVMYGFSKYKEKLAPSVKNIFDQLLSVINKNISHHLCGNISYINSCTHAIKCIKP